MNHNNTWNHRFLLSDSDTNWGGHFLILPEENKAVGASTSMGYYNSMPIPNVNFLSSSRSDWMNYCMSDPEVPYDPYLNYSSVRRSSLIPQIYSHSGSYYNHLDIRGSTSAGSSEADYERLYFKRKPSAYPMALDVMNSDEYCNVRNSNGLPVLSDHYMSIHNLGHRSWPHNSTSVLPGHPTNGTATVGERSLSHRNVRSRHNQTFQLENGLVGSHASSSLAHHFHQTASTSCYSAMSFDPHRRLASPGFFHHEITHPIRSSGANPVMEISDGFSSDPFTSRNTATAAPTLPGFPMQGDINHVQRPDPYSSARITPMEDTRQFDNVLPRWRHHRLGQNGERYGRTRSLYDSLSYRMNLLSDDGHARGRSNDEDTVMIDRSVFYDPPALFDQHRSMRMDVDNMSYEELIALGERIGNVSTGLSEDDVARCLTRKIHVVDGDADVEEASCVICLEEYKNGQSIGRLNCDHDFHAICIKKWLLIKNACPICKSAALGDKVKGKQVLLM